MGALGLALCLVLGDHLAATLARLRWPPRQVLTRRGRALSGLAFTPDGELLAVAGHGQVELWSPSSGELRAQLIHPLGHDLDVVTVSPSGAWIAASGHPGGERLESLWVPTVWVRGTGRRHPLEDRGLWEPTPLGEGEGTWTVPSRARLTHLAFSPDSRLLAALSRDGTVALWELASGALRWRRPGLAGAYAAGLAFSPRGDRLLLGPRAALDVTTGEAPSSFLPSRSTSAGPLGFARDGSLVVWTLGWGWRLRVSPPGNPSAEEASPEIPSPDHVYSPRALSPAADLFATESDKGGTLEVWSVRPTRLLARYRGHAEGARALALSPDGAWLASTSWEGRQLALWRLPAHLPRR